MKDMTPALVRVIEELPFARREAGAANISKDRKNPSTFCLTTIVSTELLITITIFVLFLLSDINVQVIIHYDYKWTSIINKFCRQVKWNKEK